MTPEEFQKIKEAEKEHLRALKKLKQAVKGIEQRNKVTKAVTDIASTTSSLLDEHENLVEKLAQQTALQEARLELAMESAADRTTGSNDLDDSAADLEQIDEDLAKKRASDLVRQMKSQMGVGIDQKTRATEEPETPINPVEKTIGRRAPAVDESIDQTGKSPSVEKNASKQGTTNQTTAGTTKSEPSESDVPEKTIGRMKPRK